MRKGRDDYVREKASRYLKYALSSFATLPPHIYQIAPTKWINWDSSSDSSEMALKYRTTGDFPVEMGLSGGVHS